MSNRFTVADFQAEIAHTMQKPFLRIKGVDASHQAALKKNGKTMQHPLRLVSY